MQIMARASNKLSAAGVKRSGVGLRARLCSTSARTLSRVKDVLPPLVAWCRGRADETAAFARRIIFIAPMRDVAADPPFTQPVVDRGVDVVYALIEHLVGDDFGLSLGDVMGTRAPRSSIAP
jgi:hypothetical protein